MADPIQALDPDAASIVGHGVGAVTSGGLGAWLMNWLRSKGERDVATQLALLRNDMNRVLESLAKAEKLAERVALLESSVSAVHARLDGRKRR